MAVASKSARISLLFGVASVMFFLPHGDGGVGTTVENSGVLWGCYRLVLGGSRQVGYSRGTFVSNSRE
ncbi:hypothetical protein [Corynebacterium efficiens YS-314]|uniref:Uncharacterized protein n=1 Tax=Corynebacterium efficiens (strain DSM 44549 / YS-314 / AJ 12310 / JCM 11189 / NBRC 100395) TaxID=196164 RepID=Q8FNN5_COREF|nr:hypothetical protein [Corynebacterium efficiens YS-314]